MTVRIDDAGTIHLEGHCPIEDAETLQMLRLANRNAPIDWTACDQVHAGVVQILFVGTPTLIGLPRGEFLRNFVAPVVFRSMAEPVLFQQGLQCEKRLRDAQAQQ